MTVEDDDFIEVDVLDFSWTEGTGPLFGENSVFNVTVKCLTPVEGGLDIEVGTHDGTAFGSQQPLLPGDYYTTYDTIHFNQNDTEKTFRVEVFKDGQREANETFRVVREPYRYRPFHQCQYRKQDCRKVHCAGRSGQSEWSHRDSIPVGAWEDNE